MEQDRQKFFSFWTIFCLFTTLLTLKLKCGKNLKKTWRYYPFTHVFIWRSYNLQFLKYTAWQTGFFVILGHFSPLTILTIWTIKILKKWKTWQEVLSFYTCVQQMMIIHYTVPEIRSMTDWIFYFGLFLPFLPPINIKNQNFEKMKKGLEISSLYTSVP